MLISIESGGIFLTLKDCFSSFCLACHKFNFAIFQVWILILWKVTFSCFGWPQKSIQKFPLGFCLWNATNSCQTIWKWSLEQHICNVFSMLEYYRLLWRKNPIERYLEQQLFLYSHSKISCKTKVYEIPIHIKNKSTDYRARISDFCSTLNTFIISLFILRIYIHTFFPYFHRNIVSPVWVSKRVWN